MDTKSTGHERHVQLILVELLRMVLHYFHVLLWQWYACENYPVGRAQI